MKLIKKGREQKGWAKEFTCTGSGNGNGGCGAILLVEKTDLFYTQEFERDGGGATHTGFQCVQCKALTDIPDKFSNIPSFDRWVKINKAEKVIV